MAENNLLDEFATQHPSDLGRRLADVFDGLLDLSDDEATSRVHQELNRLLQEKIDEACQD